MHVAIQPLSSVAATTWPSVDAVTRALVVHKSAAVSVFSVILHPGLHAIALSYIVVPVALVLALVTFYVDSCSVERVTLPLAIVEARLSLVVPSLHAFTIPLVIVDDVLAAVGLLLIFKFLFFGETYYFIAFVVNVWVDLWALAS